jgi:aspartate racemase
MKTIGLIGGMSWESSIEYYRILNQATRTRLGGLNSAKTILFSVNFADIEVLQHQERWQEASEILVEAAQKLEMAGASLVLLCTNTMHKLAEDIEARISVPFVHIADVTADCVAAEGLQRVGLLGTKFTMEQDFYRHRLTARHGLEVLIPDLSERDRVHQIIYDELCQGQVKPASQRAVAAIITNLVKAGAEGIILGCTELELLMHPDNASVPLFPTTCIHAEAAVALALEGGEEMRR